MKSNGTKISLSFNPAQRTKIILNDLDNSRTLDILTRRYGLANNGNIETLESVGSKYGITRERVRQIENHGIKSIQKSDVYAKISRNLRELADLIDNYGGVIPEDELIKMLSCTEKTKNHILFLLAVGEYFDKQKDSPEFRQHWYTNDSHAHHVREGLRELVRELTRELVLPEEEILDIYAQKLPNRLVDAYQDKKKEVLPRWLAISKKIGKNPLGEWGLANSPAVKMRGVRDFAYLVLRRNGSPMHFSEVANSIKEIFGKNANPATTHNELIKDDRFVLVGRGLYALTEWGYARGVVIDVIKEILRKEGPLTKKEIIEKVKRERYVKDNTIAVNLQDSNTFLKLDDGTYTLL